MKVLYTDIETRAAVVSTWGLFQQNIGINQVQIPTSMICFAAKWKGSRKVEFYSDFHHGHDNMVKEAHRLVDEADVVVTWNGRSFDEKHFNREFAMAGLNPPSPYQSLDLLLATRKKFKFLSNKLDWVSQQLLGDRKVSHEGFSLWEKCLAGDEKAWNRMRTYNKKDVTLLEDLHERLLPWIDGHPNVALANGEEREACTRCGSTNIQWRGWGRSKVSEYARFQCGDCGGWGRSTRRTRGSGTTEALS